MPNHWHFGELDFFADMPEEKAAFLALARERRVAKNDIVFFEEEQGETCFYLSEGMIKIFKITSMGKEPIYFLRKPGELFGLAEVMEGRARKANAQAISPVVLHEIDKADFEDLLQEHPQIARKVIQVLGRRLRYLGEQVENLMVCDVKTRLVKLLVYLCFEHLPDAEAWTRAVTLPVNLTQEQIASMTGSCQQTVSEILGQLQSQGYIHVERRAITLSSPLELLELIQH